MAVSQISMTDSDITGNFNAPSQPQVQGQVQEKKPQGMDDLMSNLTLNNTKPPGKLI
jgi:hypothetical protein